MKSILSKSIFIGVVFFNTGCTTLEGEEMKFHDAIKMSKDKPIEYLVKNFESRGYKCITLKFQREEDKIECRKNTDDFFYGCVFDVSIYKNLSDELKWRVERSMPICVGL
jgi:hypothetical protein